MNKLCAAFLLVWPVVPAAAQDPVTTAGVTGGLVVSDAFDVPDRELVRVLVPEGKAVFVDPAPGRRRRQGLPAPEPGRAAQRAGRVYVSTHTGTVFCMAP